MGHSKCTPSIAGNRGFRPELAREDAAAEHAEILKAKNAVQTVDYACRYILPALPNGTAKVPVYYAARYSGQFLWDTYQHDIVYAANKLVKTVAKEQIIPMVSGAIWSYVDDKILVSGASKALAKPAEEAFNETFATIIERGVDAL